MSGYILMDSIYLPFSGTGSLSVNLSPIGINVSSISFDLTGPSNLIINNVVAGALVAASKKLFTVTISIGNIYHISIAGNPSQTLDFGSLAIVNISMPIVSSQKDFIFSIANIIALDQNANPIDCLGFVGGVYLSNVTIPTDTFLINGLDTNPCLYPYGHCMGSDGGPYLSKGLAVPIGRGGIKEVWTIDDDTRTNILQKDYYDRCQYCQKFQYSQTFFPPPA